MKTNIKTLAAALAAIISVGVLTSCTANTAQTNPEPSETTIATTSQTTTAQPQTTSAKETTTPSSTKADTQTEKTTAPTSTAPATTATASTTKPTAVSTTKPATTSTAPASTTAPAPEWTESTASGTMYVQVAGIYSRSKAVLGAPTVKQYNLNDAVSVTAVTNTGYYKLSDGSFIHADYLGADKVTVSTTKPSTSSAAPTTVSKPAATTTKPASTTKKQSTTTPSSSSSQSGGNWKGYDMDDPDFPWDEYLKETDGGGSNFNWDDLFGNTTMPWEDEKEETNKQQQLINAWNNMSETEHRKIAYKLGERAIYYFNQLSNRNLKVEKYVQLWGVESGLQGHWEQVSGHFGVSEYVYGFDDDSLNKIAKSLAQGYFQTTEKNEYDDKKYIAFPVEFHIQSTFDGDKLTVTANFQSFWSVDSDGEKQMLKDIGLTEKDIQEVISD